MHEKKKSKSEIHSSLEYYHMTYIKKTKKYKL